MNEFQEESLLKILCEDSIQYKNLKVTKEERQQTIRALMNIRSPRPIEQNFLDVQNAYLKEELNRKGIVSLENIPTINQQHQCHWDEAKRISIWQGDITRLRVDAIVNAANSQMLGCFVPGHTCIDNEIHSAAGIQLRLECNEIMERQGREEDTGKAKITKGYNLPSNYVIHTVGPIVEKILKAEDCELLKSCYESCLALAEEYKLSSIAFCCISTGIFHFPNDKAAEIAFDTVKNWLKHSSIERVIFNVFKDEDFILYNNIIYKTK